MLARALVALALALVPLALVSRGPPCAVEWRWVSELLRRPALMHAADMLPIHLATRTERWPAEAGPPARDRPGLHISPIRSDPRRAVISM